MPQDRRRGKRRQGQFQETGQPYPQTGQQHPDLISMGQYARGFFTSAFIGAARHLSGQSRGRPIPGTTIIPVGRTRQSRQQFSDQQPYGQIAGGQGRRGQVQHGTYGQDVQPGQQVSSRKAWAIPQGKRPQLIVGKGDLAQVFSCLTQLWQECPGAAVAICRFITMHQRPTDPRAEYAVDRARNTLTRLVRKATPNDASLASAKAGVQDAKSSSDIKGRLTAQTTYLEEQYLRFVHGLATEVGLRQLANLLVANADDLQEADSEGRQAHPRIMAADVFLQLDDTNSANDQIAQGYFLIGKAYPNQEMVKLGETLQSGSSQQRPQAVTASSGGATSDN